MSMEAWDVALRWGAGLPGLLARASLEGAVFVAAIWLLCRLAPRLPAGLRCALWWLACAKLLLGLAAVPPVRLAVLPAAPTAAGPAVVAAVEPGSPVESRPFAGSLRLRSESGSPRSFPWGQALAGLWGAGVLAHLAVAGRRLRRTRGVVQRATPVEGPVARRFAEISRALGLARPPALLSSAEVATPQTTGFLSPAVLLPAAELDRLSGAELAMVLGHELAHVRRGDLGLGLVPAAAERLFFFHPLAALAAREYALAREAACDAEVLRALGAAPEAYGRLLLRLGVARRGPALAAVGAAPAFANLKRRLQMLHHAAEGRRRRALWLWLAGLAAVAGLVPFRVVAQDSPTPPEPPEVPRVAAPASPPAPPAPPAPVPPPARLASAGREAVPVPPRPPQAPRAPQAPRPPRPPRAWSSSHGGDAFVLMSGDSSTMSGSMADIARAKELRGGADEILWFRRGGKEYVVRDPAKLAAAREIWKPQAELGEKQAELGSRQAELGGRQAALGAKQAELGARQAELGAQQARLAAEQVGRGDEADDEALEEKQEELGRKQEELGRQQDELGRQQDGLGEKQDELGRQQDELGRQQDRLAEKAEKEFGAMVDRWLADGTAREVEK